MNSHYNDTDLEDLHQSAGRDREISLGTTTILGIFLALALVCAAFFGFGYSLGRRSAQTASAAPEAAAALTTNGPKPAPGSAAASNRQAPAEPAADRQAALPSPEARTVALDQDFATPVEPENNRAKTTTPPASSVHSAPAPIPTPALAASPTAPGAALVQVAAVSHQDDADILLTALKKRGYNVSIRHEPQDKLMHVQIGPFASKKEAEVMRQRLLADGYNAIVK